MTSAVTDSAGSRPAFGRIARLLRSAALKAMLGANIVAALVILGRGWGLLQPFELWIYDRLRAAWAGHSQSDYVLLVGATEADVVGFDWPLRDGDLRRPARADRRLAAAGHRRRHLSRPMEAARHRPAQDGPSAAPRDRLGLLARGPEPEGDRPAAVAARQRSYRSCRCRPGCGQCRAAGSALRGRRRRKLSDDGAGPGRALARPRWYPAGGRRKRRSAPRQGADRAARRPRRALCQCRQPGLSHATRLSRWSRPVPAKKRRRDHARRRCRAAGAQPGGHRRRHLGKRQGQLHDAIRHRVRPGRADLRHRLARRCRRSADPRSPGPQHRVAAVAAPARRSVDLGLGDPGRVLGLFVGATTPAVAGMLAGLAGLAGIVYGAFGAAVLLPALPAAIAWVGSAGLANQLLHAANNRARMHLRKTFEHYLPPAIIAEMIKSDTLPKLGGERREISVLFSDVANFTTLSESLDPVFLADLTNEYFEGVCAAVFREGGLVNEFMGDGVLAFFGAPHEQADHADRAVAAALGIDAFAQQFSAERKARGIDFGHSRIGVHTGIAMVGNIGSRSRLKYAAQGDTLNTGSRLEGLNKAIGTRISVSGETVRHTRRHRFRPVGAFVVKGRHGAIDIFEPLAAERYDPAMIARYDTAYGALVAGEPGAAAAFAALRRDYPDDPCIAFHCARLAAGATGILIVMAEK